MRLSGGLRPVRAEALAKLGAVGFFAGPAVDAIHNQALLEYDVLPLQIGGAATSFLIPPLLALTYALLGGLLPAAARAVVGDGSLGSAAPARKGELRLRALSAVAATCGIIKLSEILLESGAPNALPILALVALVEWAALDGTWASLVLGVAAAIGGPLGELPFIALGCWHYIPEAADYYPFGTGLALSSLTGPCYFAVTTDAIALGRWFDSDGRVTDATEAGPS